MGISRNKLYILLTIACLAGYSWLAFNYYSPGSNAEACMIKHVTDIPCPSCGSTRSIISMLSGDITASLYWNPIGIIILMIMISVPFWILTDQLYKKDSLYLFYRKTEKFFKQKSVAIPAILLVLANWIWNIFKGL